MALQIPPNCDLTLGLTCVDKSVPGRTVWRAKADERFSNPAGVIQGGFLAAMLDSAMGASAVTMVADRRVFVANTEMKVSFVRAAKVNDILTCVATVLKPGRVISFLEAKITDSDERLIATASSTYLIRERPE
ncbi:MAG: PaaI family thioesterase [Acidimicrobiales bacterium]